MKECFILRGIPGSGKSTRAKELASSGGVIHCTDSYFMKNGVYCFDAKELVKNHERNFYDFCKSIRQSRSPVVVDNMNTRRSQFEKYMEYAGRYGYTVQVVEMPMLSVEESFRRNTHNVPLEKIESVISIWEPYTK